MIAAEGPRVLLCDFNNFSRYPTIAIGYLTALLRNASISVDVYSPFSSGVTGVIREPAAKPWSLIDLRLRYWSAVSRHKAVRSLRRRLRERQAPRLKREAEQVANAIEERLDGSVDVVILSSYLMYHDLCEEVCRRCANRGVPVLIGGPYFVQEDICRAWSDMEGLTALIAGECEEHIVDLVRAVYAGESIDGFPGVWRPGRPPTEPRWVAPFTDLNALPAADYTDFPWDRYPNRIVPMITGRGCGWGACTFCSDVTSTAGRSYRSRSAEHVIAEMMHQAETHDTKLFVFTDLKINSDNDMWNALLHELPERLPGANWIGSVHLDRRHPEQLSLEQLTRARRAGMVRLTTGLESGSQHMLDLMKKGTCVDQLSRMLRDARQAGISVRVTMIVGYPGERTEDLEATAAFLESHRDAIERVAINRFAIVPGTPIANTLQCDSKAHPDVTEITIDAKLGSVSHDYEPTRGKEYRRAITRVLRAVHAINRNPIAQSAAAFDGVM
jgi:anaerobic magnesium-protoporphyrin IX monomethyl ester cyclase